MTRLRYRAFCLFVLAVMLPLALTVGQAKTEIHTFSVNANYGDRKAFSFEVKAAGTPAGRLDLLCVPKKQQYTQERSPVHHRGAPRLVPGADPGICGSEKERMPSGGGTNMTELRVNDVENLGVAWTKPELAG